jgi:hypothetical protein
MKTKFIGGGFPGIKECINETNIITKESKIKKEFSLDNIVSINKLISRKKTNRSNTIERKLNYKL